MSVFDEPGGLMHAADLAKSFVPGKGWVKATQAPKSVLRATGRHRKPGVDPEDARYAAQHREQTQALKEGGVKPFNPKNAKNTAYVEPNLPMQGATVRSGSKSGGKSYVLHRGNGTSAINDQVVAHEAAHATARRSGYRLARQILPDAKKTAREEARADMAAGHYFRETPKNAYDQGNMYSRLARSHQRDGAKSKEYRRAQKELVRAAPNGATQYQRMAESGAPAYAEVADKIARAKGRETTGVAGKDIRLVPHKRKKLRSSVLTNPENVVIAAGGGVAAAGIHSAKKNKEIEASRKRPVTKALEPGELAHQIELAKASRDDRKDVGTATVAGAGAGALAAPGRRINPGGRKVDPALRNLPDGTHMIDPRKLQRHTQGTSPRFGDKGRVASLAQNIKTKGYQPDKPVGLTVWRDRAMVTDGNHRTHGTATAGVRKIPVQVRNSAGRSPADQPRVFQLIDAARGQAQRRKYRARRGDAAWVDRNAKKVVPAGSLRGKINEKIAGGGATKAAAKATRTVGTLSRGKYAAANAALIGGGAVTAGGLAGAKNKRDRERA